MLTAQSGSGLPLVRWCSLDHRGSSLRPQQINPTPAGSGQRTAVVNQAQIPSNTGVLGAAIILSMDTTEVIQTIDAEIARLQEARALLNGHVSAPAKPGTLS
jgi:hypothetical protein